MMTIKCAHPIDWPSLGFSLQRGENQVEKIPDAARSILDAHVRAGYVTIEGDSEPRASRATAQAPSPATSPAFEPPTHDEPDTAAAKRQRSGV